jgi:hypothetical protein
VNGNVNLNSLLKLVQTCEKHKAFHTKHGDGKNEHDKQSDNDPSPSESADDFNSLPEQCRHDLKAVQTWMPRVEQTHLGRCLRVSAFGDGNASISSASASALYKNVTSNQVATDVTHFCAYYRSVVDGGFCPHSLFLLDEGRGGVESK